MIQARMEAEGIVEKPDVVGAVFGQTEGLLGEELDLRDLQKGGRIGRIEVDVQSKKGRSEGLIYIPSSLDQVETSILAAALETIDRVGPCKAPIKVAEVDCIARAPRGKEVEELTQKQIMKALRNKIPADQYVEMYGLSGQVYKPEPEFPDAKAPGPVPAAGRFDRGGEPRTEPRPESHDLREAPPPPLTPATKALNPKLEKYRETPLQRSGSSTARPLDERDGDMTAVPVGKPVDTLTAKKQTRAAVFAGNITQRILDIAA